jgi:predicted nucleotide-binding protein (sugar kinase/HSP70/actin superfamily)
MKVTAPHLGTGEWFLEDLLPRLGWEYFPPPKTTEKTVALGAKYAPEFACLPLKITLGNLIESLDAGADATLMVGGIGPCRFGYYADIQRRILQSLGYEYTSIIIEPPSAGYVRFAKTLRTFVPGYSHRRIWDAVETSFRKLQAFDRIEKAAIEIRCLETTPGDTSRARYDALEMMRLAHAIDEIVESEREALAIMGRVDTDPEREVLRIGIVGEFYVVLEPFVNFDIEEYLGERHCFLSRSVYASDWIGPNPSHPVAGISEAAVEHAAEPYLAHWVGGDGQASIGHTVLHARERYDGVVHFLPFTCMPDTIAKSLMPAVSKAEDIPILTLVVDEHTAKAGVRTRLEAFLDLMWARHGTSAGPVAAAAATVAESSTILAPTT